MKKVSKAKKFRKYRFVYIVSGLILSGLLVVMPFRSNATVDKDGNPINDEEQGNKNKKDKNGKEEKKYPISNTMPLDDTWDIEITQREVSKTEYDEFGEASKKKEVEVEHALKKYKGEGGIVTTPTDKDITKLSNYLFFTNKNVTDLVLTNNIESCGDASLLDMSKLNTLTILNPDCDMSNINVMAGNGNNKIGYGHKPGTYSDLVIYGYDGSTAEKFVKELNKNKQSGYKNITFVSLGSKDAANVTPTYSELNAVYDKLNRGGSIYTALDNSTPAQTVQSGASIVVDSETVLVMEPGTKVCVSPDMTRRKGINAKVTYELDNHSNKHLKSYRTKGGLTIDTKDFEGNTNLISEISWDDGKVSGYTTRIIVGPIPVDTEIPEKFDLIYVKN